jgi:hypothetical protein
MARRIAVLEVDPGFDQKVINAVRKASLLNVYRRWYEYYRPKLKERFKEGSKTTPYAESSLGKRKRSGEIIRQVPQSLFNQDTLKLYNSVIRDVKISDYGLDIKTDVSYAPYALAKFKQKGSLAPQGLFTLDRDDVSNLELFLLEEYESVFQDIPDDLY